MHIKTILKIILVLLTISIIVGYSYYKSKDFITGPRVSIISPKNGVSVKESLVEITGVADNISYISMDNRQIYTNEKGIFKEKLLLSPGYNIISITARDQFDRKTEKTLEIVYNTPIKQTDNTSEGTSTPTYTDIKTTEPDIINGTSTLNKKTNNARKELLN